MLCEVPPHRRAERARDGLGVAEPVQQQRHDRRLARPERMRGHRLRPATLEGPQAAAVGACGRRRLGVEGGIGGLPGAGRKIGEPHQRGRDGGGRQVVQRHQVRRTGVEKRCRERWWAGGIPGAGRARRRRGGRLSCNAGAGLAQAPHHRKKLPSGRRPSRSVRSAQRRRRHHSQVPVTPMPKSTSPSTPVIARWATPNNSPACSG